MSRTFLIAEAGSTHDGELEKALRLVDVANACFADAVKFQFWSSSSRLADRRNAPEFATTYFRYQMPERWLPELKARCDQIGIEFMCTTYLPEDIATVAPFVQRFKIASFEADDANFIGAHSHHAKPVLISAGMAAAHRIVVSAMCSMRQLHCVSAYPAPIEDLNLRVLSGGHYIGFSDHSRHLVAGAVAVACGAEILEVHFRLDDTDPDNPDYAVAFTPYELTEYICNVRDTEKMLGDGRKRLMPSEAPMARYRVRS